MPYGTTYNFCQYNEVLVAIARCLPKALEGTDPKKLIPLLKKSGEKISEKIAEILRSLPMSYPTVGEVFELTLEPV